MKVMFIVIVRDRIVTFKRIQHNVSVPAVNIRKESIVLRTNQLKNQLLYHSQVTSKNILVPCVLRSK